MNMDEIRKIVDKAFEKEKEENETRADLDVCFGGEE